MNINRPHRKKSHPLSINTSWQSVNLGVTVCRHVSWVSVGTIEGRWGWLWMSIAIGERLSCSWRPGIVDYSRWMIKSSSITTCSPERVSASWKIDVTPPWHATYLLSSDTGGTIVPWLGCLGILIATGEDGMLAEVTLLWSCVVWWSCVVSWFVVLTSSVKVVLSTSHVSHSFSCHISMGGQNFSLFIAFLGRSCSTKYKNIRK